MDPVELSSMISAGIPHVGGAERLCLVRRSSFFPLRLELVGGKWLSLYLSSQVHDSFF